MKRWDYIFSTIKKFRNNPQFVLPERKDVGMTAPFMDAYVRQLIKVCHKRGVHAMGGMAAQIPIKDDPAANEAALKKVREDKLREVKAGHDGTWVAHPELVKIALEIFNTHMPQVRLKPRIILSELEHCLSKHRRSPSNRLLKANQLYVTREDVNVTASDLLNVRGCKGVITEQGLRSNIDVGLTYMEAWLRGNGCVPIHNLMEDAATAEISRSQVWQWVRHRAQTSNGKVITADWVIQILDEEVNRIRRTLGEDKYRKGKWEQAKKFLAGTIIGKDYADFLTTLCYDSIVVKSSTSKL